MALLQVNFTAGPLTQMIPIQLVPVRGIPSMPGLSDKAAGSFIIAEFLCLFDFFPECAK